MGLSTNGPITPWLNSWAYTLDADAKGHHTYVCFHAKGKLTVRAPSLLDGARSGRAPSSPPRSADRLTRRVTAVPKFYVYETQLCEVTFVREIDADEKARDRALALTTTDLLLRLAENACRHWASSLPKAIKSIQALGLMTDDELRALIATCA